MKMNLQQPRWGNVGVIALVPDSWSSVWMDRHHVLTRLAAYFHVVWMHQPGWRHSLSAMHPGSGTPTANPASAGAMQLYEPGFWLPRLSRPRWLSRLTAKRRFKQVCGLLRTQGC